MASGTPERRRAEQPVREGLKAAAREWELTGQKQSPGESGVRGVPRLDRGVFFAAQDKREATI